MEELVKIQSELKAPKNNYNSFGKYKYRSAEGILEAVKPLLKENGCYLTLSDDVQEVGGRIYIKATARITNKDQQHVEVSAYAREEETKKGMDASQITGTASSYARKYALNGLFAIDDTKDADALNTSDDYTARPDGHAPSADLTMALTEVRTAKNRNELMQVWNQFAHLQRNVDFLNAVTEQGKTFAK